MSTPITAEAIFDRYVVALGLPLRDAEQSFADYIAQHGKLAEAARCLTHAVEAACVGLHADVSHWLAQARQHMPAAGK